MAGRKSQFSSIESPRRMTDKSGLAGMISGRDFAGVFPCLAHLDDCTFAGRFNHVEQTDKLVRGEPDSNPSVCWVLC